VGHDGSVTLRVMTWNLWWRFGDWEQRERAILEVVRSVDPDVLCLQEAWADPDGNGPANRLAEEFGRHAVSSTRIGRHDVGFTNAVVSRWPLTPLADEALPRTDGSPGHRRIVAGIAATPWGPWTVASTHLDHRFDDGALREVQARRVLELAASWRSDPASDLPPIVGADLNAVPDSDEVRMLTGRRPGVDGIVFSDAWEQVGEGHGATWRRDNPYCADSAWPNRRLDYVLVGWPRPKPVGNPLAARLVAEGPVDVDGERIWASDHAAVVVDLATADTPSTP
jgi:endonuclease/exonuclease/phosphatase family metal-dependent hydrolase